MTRLVKRESALGTLAQSLGRAPLLLRHMQPTWFMNSLTELDLGFVARHAIQGLIWDVDGTLTGYHHREVLPELAGTFRALQDFPGLRHAILSNAPEWRTQELARMFPRIPIVRGYLVGGAVIGRRLLDDSETWYPALPGGTLPDAAVPLRKPSADLVRLAVEALGCPPAGAVMVGDQHLTDIAGANLAGVRSLKVRNPARGSFPWSIQVSQRLEALVYRLSVLAGGPRARP